MSGDDPSLALGSYSLCLETHFTSVQNKTDLCCNSGKAFLDPYSSPPSSRKHILWDP